MTATPGQNNKITQIHNQKAKGGRPVKDNKRLTYEPPKTEVTYLEKNDVIATSGSLGWESDGNYDSGGWT